MYNVLVSMFVYLCMTENVMCVCVTMYECMYVFTYLYVICTLASILL